LLVPPPLLHPASTAAPTATSAKARAPDMCLYVPNPHLLVVMVNPPSLGEVT
jgi:hypothetical protein